MHIPWTQTEKKIARKAFDLAYQSEIQSLMEETRRELSSIQEAEKFWAWHDRLNEKREHIDAKYDYRYSQLIHVFGLLMAEGRLTREQLAGLDAHKLQQIEAVRAAIEILAR